MSNSEKRTHRLVRVLGLASIGLGVPMLRRPDDVAEFAGVDNMPLAPTVIKAVGAREMVHAGLCLMGPPRSILTRVAGDAMDYGLLAFALQSRKGDRRRRTTNALAVVLGITALDVVASARTARKRKQHGTGRPGPLELHASTTVNRTPDEAYSYWRDFENLPNFMLHLRSVHGNGDGRSTWEANAPVLRKVTWDADLTGDVPGRRISWKSVPGSQIDNSGTVHFAPAPGDRGTEVSVDLHYDVSGGRLGRVAAKLLGEEPEQQVRDDLRRFKQVIETGDIVRSDSFPHGTDARYQLVQSPAMPAKKEKARNHR